MYKGLIKCLGYALFVVIVIFLAVNTWFANNSTFNKNTAEEYLDQVLPVVLSWNKDSILPFLNDHAEKQLSLSKRSDTFDDYSELGKFNSHKGYIFMGSTFEHKGKSTKELVNYSMLGQFENGDALIIITLAVIQDEYAIHQLTILSPAASTTNQ